MAMLRSRGVRTLLLVAAAAAVPVASADVLGGETRATPAERARGSIDRFARVAPGVWRGAQPDVAGFRALRDLGVRTVVDLRMDHDERAVVRSLGMRAVSIPMPGGDEAPAPSKKVVRRFFEVVLDPALQPVFVHCAHGKDRTGALFAAYRIEVSEWSRRRAMQEMHALGFEDSHRNLLRFVQTYERRGYEERLTFDDDGDGGTGAEAPAEPAAAPSTE